MKPHSSTYRKPAGFTLIEMIGVLAVIAILAAVLVPRIFEAINSARVSNAAITCNTVNTAIADHYAKAGSLPVDASVNPPVAITSIPIEHFDMVPLLKEGFLAKPFTVKIGDGISGNADNMHSRVRLFDIHTLVNTAPSTAAGANDGFNLDGVNNQVVGSLCVEAVITHVLMNDAWELSKRMDGDSLSATNASAADPKGAVKYDVAAADGTTTVYVYLTHR
jgi:prepilin-type N-terminal cleavage/methylation domain-containing protein